MLFLCNSGCMNAPQCYVIRTLPVLYFLDWIIPALFCVESPLILPIFLDFVHTSDIMCKFWRWNKYIIELLRCSAQPHVRQVLVSNSRPDSVSTNIVVSLAKQLRKATVTFAMSVYISARSHGTEWLSPDGFSWDVIFGIFDGFSCNVIFGIFTKICRNMPSTLHENLCAFMICRRNWSS
jgi:hypothetical protein